MGSSNLLSTLSVVSSGLSVVNTQLEVTASNVTNAGTEGYTKKSVILQTTTAGGVEIAGYRRATNDALFDSLTTVTSEASYRSTQDTYMQQVMDIYGMSSSDSPPIAVDLTAFINAWTALEAEPDSSVASQNVIQTADNFADEILRLTGDIEDLDRQCFAEINASIEDLNAYLSQIQDLNIKIATARTTGLSSGDLEDVRDQILIKITELVDVKTLSRQNGQIAIFTPAGYQLLDGGSIASFYYDGSDLYRSDNLTLPLNNTLTGGSIQALVDFRDTSASATSSTLSGVGTIQKMRDQLDLIVDAFLTTTTTATSGEDTFAAAYNNGATGAGELASDFFTGTNRTNFAVNSSLLDGSATIKEDSIGGVVDALLDATRVFSTSGLSVAGASYSSVVNSSLTEFQHDANSIATMKETASNMQQYLTEQYSNETNVSVDDEMINLVTLQNVYSANARVLTVIQELFDVLRATV